MAKGQFIMAWEEDDQAIYMVVVNHEEQYSIWPNYKELPNGWRAVGKTGLKPECLTYINEVWTDMRPLSLRKQMAEADASRKKVSRRTARDAYGAGPAAPQT
jgi:MbtH protein